MCMKPRTIEYPELEGDHKDHQVQHQPLAQKLI